MYFFTTVNRVVDVAVKELKKEKLAELSVVNQANFNGEREKFIAEAKLMAQLYHPKVVFEIKYDYLLTIVS